MQEHFYLFIYLKPSIATVFVFHHNWNDYNQYYDNHYCYSYKEEAQLLLSSCRLQNKGEKRVGECIMDVPVPTLYCMGNKQPVESILSIKSGFIFSSDVKQHTCTSTCNNDNALLDDYSRAC